MACSISAIETEERSTGETTRRRGHESIAITHPLRVSLGNFAAPYYKIAVKNKKRVLPVGRSV